MVGSGSWTWGVVVGIGAVACAPEDTAENALASTFQAPAVELDVGERRDLGLWDDVVLPSGDESLILRRDSELFSLALGSGSSPEPRAEIPEAEGSRIVFGVRGAEETWLFFESETRVPFAFGLRSKTRLSFEVPGWEAPPGRPPVIQSWVVGAGSAVLMISGGESSERWPRPGNRPIYFWVSLSSGKTAAITVGWDLAYFSEDQGVAVFEKPQEEQFQRRPLAGVDMKTGELAAAIPDRGEQRFVRFNWSDTAPAKPLFAPRRPQTGDLDSIVGVSLEGKAVPLQLSIAAPYIPTVKASGSWVAFHCRGNGSPREEDDSLWFGRLAESVEPVRVDTGVQDFTIIGPGKCLFVQSGHGPKQTLSEAFVYDAAEDIVYNALGGVERLPPLDAALAAKSYVADRMAVRLIDGIGASGAASLALALFEHVRMDERAYFELEGTADLATEVWRHTLVISSNGRRYSPDLFREGSAPELIYLHNSGELIVGKYRWSQEGERRVRRIQLSAIELDL